jgi:hypothetical protein
MKDGNLAVLYTKEIRKVYATCSVAAEQTEQTEQQSSRAIEHSAGHMVPRSTAWQLVIASVIAYRNLLPEAL